VIATLEADVTGPREKTQFARVRLRRSGDGWLAAPTGPRGSNLAATMSRADGLAVIPVGMATAAAGTSVRVTVIREGA
jgi:molybdopterin biosynthesis enzyme